MDSAIHIPRISHDLLRPIFENLESDKALLCAISLVSTTFRDEAQRILFRDAHPFHPRTYNSHIKFLRTVAASPTRLALFVHSYTTFLMFSDSDTEKFVKILPTVVKDGLKAMRRLKDLTIFISTTSPSYSHHIPTTYIRILSTCTFTLERFVWIQRNTNVYELIENGLTHQPALRHLELDSKSEPNPLYLVPSTTCPRLISIDASWPMIKAFLPGHNISTISLNYTGKEISEADFKLLAVELKRIKALAVDFFYLREPGALDHSILQSCTSLDVLKIQNIQSWEDDEEPDPPIDVPHLLNILSHLPKLQTLLMYGSPETRNRAEDLELSHHAFAKFGQHLKYIDYQTFDGCDRHIQSQEIIQEIDVDELRTWWLPSL